MLQKIEIHGCELLVDLDGSKPWFVPINGLRSMYDRFMQFFPAPEMAVAKRDALISAKQEPEWHPEGDSFVHTLVVMYRAAMFSEVVQYPFLSDILFNSALLHDLEKGSTAKQRDVRGRLRWTAYGHEQAAVRFMHDEEFVKKKLDYPRCIGDCFEPVRYIVGTHMRIKQMPRMKKAKQDIMRQHKWFRLLEEFNKMDTMLVPYVPNAELDVKDFF